MIKAGTTIGELREKRNRERVAAAIESLSKRLGDVDISGCEAHVWDDIAHIQLELGSLADRLRES